MAIDHNIINLRQARKERAKTEARATATTNAAKFGRSKIQKSQGKQDTDKARRSLDGHLRVVPFKPE